MAGFLDACLFCLVVEYAYAEYHQYVFGVQWSVQIVV